MSRNDIVLTMFLHLLLREEEEGQRRHKQQIQLLERLKQATVLPLQQLQQLQVLPQRKIQVLLPQKTGATATKNKAVTTKSTTPRKRPSRKRMPLTNRTSRKKMSKKTGVDTFDQAFQKRRKVPIKNYELDRVLIRTGTGQFEHVTCAFCDHHKTKHRCLEHLIDVVNHSV